MPTEEPTEEPTDEPCLEILMTTTHSAPTRAIHARHQATEEEIKRHDIFIGNVSLSISLGDDHAPRANGSRLGSMDPVGRSKEGTWVYVGLADRSPGYRLLDLRTGTILETVDAKIDEDTTSRRDALTGLLKPHRARGLGRQGYRRNC